jgi:hypothetical protein
MRHKENIKSAQHSKVGRVNLGARIAPKASRKCQDVFIGKPRIYTGKRRLPKQEGRASKVGVESCSTSRMMPQ